MIRLPPDQESALLRQVRDQELAAAPPLDIDEAELQARVVALAKHRGWMVFHVWNSRNSQPGFPDLTLCRPPEALFLELKTEKGRVSAEQQQWLDALRPCGGVTVRLCRPRDWATLEALLR
jgi:VRR-NUC domain